MSNTAGNYYGDSCDNHYFVTNDPVMVHLGLGTFTKKNIDNALKTIKEKYGTDISDEDFYNDLNNNQTIDLLFIIRNSSNWTATTFNKGGGSYSSITQSWSALSTMIDTFEEKVLILTKDHGDKATHKAEVNSARRWISANIGSIQHGDRCYELRGALLSNDSNVSTRLYFHVPGSNSSVGDPAERVVAQRGLPCLSAVATSSTGLKYSKDKTRRARISGHPGTFIKPSSLSGDVSSDLATGNIRLSYNEGLGMWESCQTILARLITELPAPENKPFQVPEEGADGFLETEQDANEFYNRGSKFFTGNFTTGIAIPVSTHNGNPYQFGPNVIVDYNEKRIEKIRVVNRSDKIFTEGTLVLCTLIGAEWIVQEFGNPANGLPVQLGAWTFSKLIANSDSFFRRQNKNEDLLSVSKYEEWSRTNFYRQWASSSPSLASYHDVQDIMDLNKIDSTLKVNPSNGYFINPSEDSAQYFIKGTSAERVNREQGGFALGVDLPLFWGAMFPDGYYQGDGGGGGFAGPFDEIPADMAVRGEFDEDGNSKSSPRPKIEYLQQLLEGQATLPSAFSTYLNDQWEGTGIGLTPKNPNKVQFSPLSAEMVVHADQQVVIGTPNSKKATLKEFVDTTYNPNGDPHLFGNMFDRFSTSKMLNYPTTIPYDEYNTTLPLTKPSGNPRVFTDGDSQDDGLQLVGITAAINRFTKPGGGAFNIEVFEDIGIPQFTSVTAGQAPAFNGVAALFGFTSFSGGTDPRTYGFPQWGNSADSYNNFGTTALHCRIFDSWPRKDTIWDTRYFSVLHFAPNPEPGEDNALFDFEYPNSAVGTAINKDSSVTFYKDTIARRKLLPFRCRIPTISLDPSSMVIANAGSNLKAAPYKEVRNGIEMDVEVTNGSVTGVTFTNGKFIEDDRSVHLEQKTGRYLKPNSFSGQYIDDSGNEYTGYIINFGNAVLVFQGIVRNVVYECFAPRDHGGIKRLTSATGGDSGRITGTKTSEFALAPNSSNKYEAYFFFHNDISHTIMTQQGGSQIPGFLQYVLLTIS